MRGDVWHFFDGVHEHTSAAAAEAGLLLGSSRRGPFLCYADDVILLSDNPQGLQHLIDSMQSFRVSVGLVISVAKTEVILSWG